MEYKLKYEQIVYINSVLKAKEKFLLDREYINQEDFILSNEEILFLLECVKEFIPLKLYEILEFKFNFVKDLNNTQYLRLDCFLNYLFVFNIKDVNSSVAVINNSKSTICILYEEVTFSLKAKRIIITCGAKDFDTVIISNKEGLAEVSGTFAFTFPEGYFKFSSIFKVLI